MPQLCPSTVIGLVTPLLCNYYFWTVGSPSRPPKCTCFTVQTIESPSEGSEVTTGCVWEDPVIQMKVSHPGHGNTNCYIIGKWTGHFLENVSPLLYQIFFMECDTWKTVIVCRNSDCLNTISPFSYQWTQRGNYFPIKAMATNIYIIPHDIKIEPFHT